MSLAPGDVVELIVEKPASGGRMIARHQGEIVLVLGAIPGERVRARIDKAEKRLAFASTLEALTPSADRREAAGDPLCGGCVFNHITYPRQVALKAEIIADAFTRIGRLPLPGLVVAVAPSPEHGYRMRARLHVRGGSAGFFREGTHALCDAGPTGQLLPDTVLAVERARAVLAEAGVTPASIEVSENIAADERAIHVELGVGGPTVAAIEPRHQTSRRERGSERWQAPGPPRPVIEDALDALVTAVGLTGATARTPNGAVVAAGEPAVSDPLSVLTGGRAPEGGLSRSPESFFQGNRHLLPALVTTVTQQVPADGDVVDLYAGVGLFSIALGATGRGRITAVESDRASMADLKRNAVPWRGVRPHAGRVEDYLARRPGEPARIIIVDPPRTGISREAMERIARHGAMTVIYVSCDPPTMARDARRLVGAGYSLASVTGFDLFPNTPHVETVGVFALK